MTTEAQEAQTRPRGWCSQHKQPRSACRPADRHVQSFRASDELLDAVAAKAATMGLSRNDGIEMALEVLVGWHEAGKPWKGPAQWTGSQRRDTLAAGMRNASERRAAERILEARGAEIRRRREDGTGKAAPAARKGAEIAAKKARDAQIVAAAGAGVNTAHLAAEYGLSRQRILQIISDAGAVTTGNGAPATAPQAAPGSAVFLEPGGKPVIAAAVPQVPASRGKKGRRS